MGSVEHSDAIDRAVQRLKARLTTLRGSCEAAASLDDTYRPSRLDFCQGLCDTALRDCEAIETLTLKADRSSIDHSKASLNLRLMQTLADVIATSRPEANRRLLQMLEQMRPEADGRQWPRKLALLPITLSRVTARVLDLSYGGLRLELPEPADFEAPLDVTFPTLGLSIKAVPRWMQPNDSQSVWWCGAEVAPLDREAQQTWRGVVDAFN